VREPEHLRAAFQVLPDYLRDVAAGENGVNFADYGEQLTRQSRALKVWLGVRYFGVAAIRAEIDRAMDLAVYAESVVRQQPLLEVMAPAQLGVLCFRVRPEGLGDPAALDALNERVNAAVGAGGRYLISSTRLRGTFTLRMCILGFRTTAADVEGLIREVVDCGRHQSLQAPVRSR
jgi:aromatic-L-amino-acid decarboxylase